MFSHAGRYRAVLVRAEILAQLQSDARDESLKLFREDPECPRLAHAAHVAKEALRTLERHAWLASLAKVSSFLPSCAC